MDPNAAQVGRMDPKEAHVDPKVDPGEPYVVPGEQTRSPDK